MSGGTSSRTGAAEAGAGEPVGETAPGRWVEICALEAILPDTGVGALVGGKQVAVFRTGATSNVYALQNFDPFSKAFVLCRGIVGDKAGVPKVTSPIFKQGYDLRTGQCLDDPTVKIRAYPARVVDGRVEIFIADASRPGP